MSLISLTRLSRLFVCLPARKLSIAQWCHCTAHVALACGMFQDNRTVDDSAAVGFSYVGVMLLASVLQTMALHQYFFRVLRVGMNLRSAVVLAVYQKSIAVSVPARQARSLGEIVNIMSTGMCLCTFLEFSCLDGLVLRGMWMSSSISSAALFEFVECVCVCVFVSACASDSQRLQDLTTYLQVPSHCTVSLNGASV